MDELTRDAMEAMGWWLLHSEAARRAFERHRGRSRAAEAAGRRAPAESDRHSISARQGPAQSFAEIIR